MWRRGPEAAGVIAFSIARMRGPGVSARHAAPFLLASSRAPEQERDVLTTSANSLQPQTSRTVTPEDLRLGAAVRVAVAG